MPLFTRKQIAVAVAAASLGFTGPMAVAGKSGELSFQEVPVPETDSERRQVLASPTAVVDGTEYKIGFHTLMRNGTTLNNDWPGNVFGGILGDNGEYIRQVDGSILNSRDSGMDHNSLIDAHGKLWLVSQFESRPGAVYVTELEQDEAGHLYPLSTKPVDFSPVKGGWVHCAGSQTPWNTHLGSEEYEPDARQWSDPSLPISDYNAAMVEYFTDTEGNNYDPTPENAQKHMNPYDYGYAWEVKILNDNGDNSVEKHYAMGRMAMELAYVMPDKKTVYLTDDGTNVGMFMFVAEDEQGNELAVGNLSQGTLYAARWIQKPEDKGGLENGGNARIRWVNLGHAKAEKIKAALEAKKTFADMFAVSSPRGDGSCEAGFASINTGHGSPYQECVKLTDYAKENPHVVSRLETRRYAAYMGATTEWRKMEGITFDAKRSKLYLAISEINSGMLDKPTGTYDIGGRNDIRVPENFCGGVYSLTVKGGLKDTDGSAIRSNFVASNMKGLIVGSPVTVQEKTNKDSDYFVSGDPEQTPNGKYAANVCHVDAIANPDNLTYMEFYDTLIIGEDSVQGHQNDMMWAFNIKEEKKGGENPLTRIFTTPYGSETTSPYWYPNVRGFGYLLGVIQHPYGENDGSPGGEPQPKDRYTIGTLADRDWTGYIGPFPPMD